MPMVGRGASCQAAGPESAPVSGGPLCEWSEAFVPVELVRATEVGVGLFCPYGGTGVLYLSSVG